ncbi:MAG: hypothetical protein AAF004_08330 [Pseudomonadota bacterium]
MQRSIIIATITAVAILGLAGYATASLWDSDETVVLPAADNPVQRQLESTLVRHAVSFSYDEEQRIRVAADDLHIARSLADAEGLINVRTGGFELFTDADYGATEFVQSINYQRALQAELERSIASIDGVRDVRVHVLQPEKSSFFRRENSGRASVILDLDSSTRLAELAPSVEQILVGAVDGLAPDRVKIVSAAGMLSNRGEHASDRILGAERLERKLAATVVHLLEPFVSDDELRVTVSVDQLAQAESSLEQPATPVGDEPLRDTMSAASEASPSGKAGARIGVALVMPAKDNLPELSDIEQLVFVGLSLSEPRGDTVKAVLYSPSATEPVSVQTTAAAVATDQPPLDVIGAGFDVRVIAIVMLGSLLMLLVAKVGQRHRRERRLWQDISAWVADDET